MIIHQHVSLVCNFYTEKLPIVFIIIIRIRIMVKVWSKIIEG